MLLVIKLKLQPEPAQHAALLTVMGRFNEACDWLAGNTFAERTAYKYLLQRRHYGHLRAEFGLGAQMAVRVIAKVCEAYKSGQADSAPLPPARGDRLRPAQQRA